MDISSTPTLTYWREGHLPGENSYVYEEPHDTQEPEIKTEASQEENE